MTNATAQPEAAATAKAPAGQTAAGAEALSAADLERLNAVDDELKTPEEHWADFEAEDQAAAAKTSGADPEPPAADEQPEGEEVEPKDTGAAAKASATETGQGAGAAPDKDQQGDLWASATPAQRAAWQGAQAEINRLAQSDRSQRGRLSALQRQLNEAMSGTGKGAPDGAPNAGAGDKPDPQAERLRKIFSSDKWKSVEAEYPEIAEPFRDVMLEGLGVVQKDVSERLSQGELDTLIDEQTELLDGLIPDWEQVIEAAPEEWDRWVADQPSHLQWAARRNANAIVDAAAAADVIGRFKAFRSQQSESSNEDPTNGKTNGNGQASQAGNDQQSQQQAGAGSQPEKGKTGNGLSGKRQRQLEAAASARGTGPGAASGIPPDGDPQDLWNAWEQYDQQQAQREAAVG